MDGYELAERTRMMTGLEKIRIIVLTGYAQETDKRRARAGGFDAHLTKPLDIDLLDAAARRRPSRAKPQE